VFVEVLEAMEAPVRLTGSVLHVERTDRLRPVDWDLKDSPDLFPVLSVLCGLAEGKSRLFGAPHLSRKESNRIAKSAELLRRMQRPVEELPDGLVIEGGGFRLHRQPFEFSPAKDHRLAMAASVARKVGFPIRIKDRGVVAKSFPGFWRRIGERE
jgi:3-phosphoshikimate 1-carboxyvinyltransferase